MFEAWDSNIEESLATERKNEEERAGREKKR